jgi:hypothetical protein
MRKTILAILLPVLLATAVQAEPQTPLRRVASFTLPRSASTSLYVPYISNGAGGVFSAVRIFNTAEGSIANVDLVYRDTSGTAILQQHIDLPPYGSAQYGPASYGRLSAGFQGSLTVTSNQPLAGVALYDQPAWTGDGLMACPALEGRVLPQAVPGLGESATVQTLLAIQNTGQGTTTAQITLYADDGSTVAHTSQAIPASTSYLVPLADLIAPATDFSGSVQVTASQPLAIYALSRRPGQELAECSPATRALALLPPESVPETHFLPKISRTDTGATNAPRWLAFNPDPAGDSAGTMDYRDQDGQGPDEDHTIPARETLRRLISDTSLPDDWVGAGVYEIDSSQAVRVVGSSVISATRPYWGSYASSPSATVAWMPALLLQPDQVKTEIALQNASDATLTIDATFHNALGTQVTAYSDVLQRLGVQVYGPLDDMLAGLPATYSGGARIDSGNGRSLAVVGSLIAGTSLVTSGCEAVDRDRDGQVRIDDVQRFAAGWGTILGQAGYVPALDLNGNGVVDLIDLTLAAEWWTATC